MIIAGYKVRLAALALLPWMIPVTLLFHAFWAVPTAEQQLQQIMFLKSLGLMGGILLLAAFGSGLMSRDRK